MNEVSAAPTASYEPPHAKFQELYEISSLPRVAFDGFAPRLLERDAQSIELSSMLFELEKAKKVLADGYRLAPVALLSIDKGGMIRESNVAAGILLGCEADFLSRCDFARFVAPECRQAFRRFLNGMQGGGRARWKATLLSRSGRRFHALLDGLGTAQEDGSWMCRLAVCDVSCLKRFALERHEIIEDSTVATMPEESERLVDQALGGAEVDLESAAPRNGKVELMFHKELCRMSIDGQRLVRDMPARLLRKMVCACLSTGCNEFRYRDFIADPEMTLNPQNPSLIIRLRRLARSLERTRCGLSLQKVGRGRVRLALPVSLEYREE